MTGDALELDHVVWTSPGRYEHTVTPECFKGGNGACDGFSEGGAECSCPCHQEGMPMPDGQAPKMVGDMTIAHEHYWTTTQIASARGVGSVESDLNAVRRVFGRKEDDATDRTDAGSAQHPQQ